MLRDTAQDDLANKRRIQTVALLQCSVKRFEQVKRQQIMQAARFFGTPAGCADGIVNVCLAHQATPITKLAQVVVLPPMLKVIIFSAFGNW